ncbi:MAG: flavodoxin family protein [Planctomycetes bacterium]|nr:flavodoxin family protein [Planctomycetota bacterium]
MTAIAINGSPRAGGNTELLLKKVLEPLEQAGWNCRLLQIGGRAVRGCSACYQCFERKNKRCAVENDAMNDFLEAIYAADAVIVGTPTYFADVSAEIKALLDRAGLVSTANDGLLKGKIGAAVAAVRRGGATHAFDSINHMFLMSSMIVPGSIYWNFGKGLNKGEVLNDEEALRNMNHLGRVIAWLGQAVAQAAVPFPEPPIDER